MPLSTLYKVVARYEADTSTAERRVERLAKKAEKQAKAVERAKRAFSGFATVAKGALAGGVALGVGFLTRRMGSLTKEAENAKISIAAIFEQSNPGKFAQNLARAGGLLKRFQKASITSPATSREFQTLFSQAAPGLAPLGLGDEQITKFIARAVPTAIAFTGGDFEQAGRDVLQILQGRAGSDVKTFVSLRDSLLKATGAKDTEGLNKLAQANPQKIFDALNKALEGMDSVNQEFATSLTGLVASATEFGDRFLRTVGGPVFAQLKVFLVDLVKWFERNEEKVREFGEMIGNKLAKGLRVVKGLSADVLENFRGLLVVGSALAAKKIFDTIAPAGAAGRGLHPLLGAGLSSARGFGARNLASARAVRSRVAGGLRRGAGGALGFGAGALGEVLFGSVFGGGGGGKGGAFVRGARAMPGRIRAAPGKLRAAHAARFGAGAASIFTLPQQAAMAAKSGGLAILTKGLPALGAGLGTLAAVALPLTVIIGGVIGTFRVLKDESNEATMFLRTSIDEFMIAVDTIAGQLGFEGGASGAFKKFADWLGTGVVGIFGLVTKAAERLATGVSLLFAVFKGAFLGIGSILNQLETGGLRAAFDPNFVKKAFSAGMATAFAERDVALRKAFKDREKKKKDEKDEVDKGSVAGGAKPPQIKVEIHQTITTDANPDRIAFRVGEVIGDVARKFPRSVAGAVAR